MIVIYCHRLLLANHMLFLLNLRVMNLLHKTTIKDCMSDSTLYGFLDFVQNHYTVFIGKISDESTCCIKIIRSFSGL